MSIVKDLLLFLFFIVLIIRYCVLLRQIKQQKEYFLNVLNHDLKVSVLAQIRGLNLLKNKNLSQDDKDCLIENIIESGEYSLDMISMLLNTYRFENGENIVKYEEFDFSELLEKCSAKLNRLALEKRINIVYQMSSDLFLEADKNFITKLCLILLLTAITNSNKEQPIMIFAKKKMGNLNVSIAYKGKPLSEEEQRRMFSKNSRFSTVGHGIKMNLCKKIIDFHCGNIYVKKINENLNCFTFTLPVSKPKISLKCVSTSGLQASNV